MSTSLTPSKRPNDRSFKEPNSKGKRKTKKLQKLPPGSTIVKVLCPASKAGNIIGKGGAVISQIREETGAKVRVEETIPGCDERVVTIVGCDGELREASDHAQEGTSNNGDANKEGENADEDGKSNEDAENSKSKKGPSSLQKALLRVFEKLVEEENESDKGDENGNKTLSIVLRLLVISSQVGCILGKGGNVIKQMSTDSGTQIRILPRDKVPLCVLPSDELVQITGEMDAVKKAIHLLSQQLLENPLRDPGIYLANPAGSSSHARAQSFAARGAPFGSGPHDVVGGAHSLAPSMIPRFSEGGIPGGLKPSHEMLSFRLLCHQERVGGIIGKGGMIVKTLQQETGCEINVVEGASDSEDRIIAISGPVHPDDRISAIQDAVLRVQARIVRAVPDNQESPAVARILVSSNQIGCLLGKGGSIIAEMRKSSGAFIRIMGKDQIPKCASENEEVVQINGDFEAVQEALLQITHRLRHHFFYGSTPMDRLPNPTLLDPLPPLPPYMGRELSPSGMFSNFGPPHHKFDAVGVPPGAFYPHDDRPPFMNNVFRPGVRPLMPERQHWGPEGLNEVGGPLGFSDFGGAAPRRMGFGGGNQPAIITSTTIEVVVPRSVVPAIYGEDGGCLRQIRQISDAKITITDPKPGDTETIIIISGTPEQTHAAQSLIQAFVLSETETV